MSDNYIPEPGHIDLARCAQTNHTGQNVNNQMIVDNALGVQVDTFQIVRAKVLLQIKLLFDADPTWLAPIQNLQRRTRQEFGEVKGEQWRETLGEVGGVLVDICAIID